MNPPSGIDMSLIQEALARRAGPQGGTGMPMQQQVTPGAPVQQTPQVAPTGPLQQPQAPQGQMPQQGQPQPAQGGQAGQGQRQPANFDDDTKATAKALVARLLKVL